MIVPIPSCDCAGVVESITGVNAGVPNSQTHWPLQATAATTPTPTAAMMTSLAGMFFLFPFIYSTNIYLHRLRILLDFDIEEKEAKLKDDLRGTSGIGHKRRKVSIVAFYHIKVFHWYHYYTERACCRSHTLTAGQGINRQWKPSICRQRSSWSYTHHARGYSNRTSSQHSMVCARSVLWRYEWIAKSFAVEDYGSSFATWRQRMGPFSMRVQVFLAPKYLMLGWNNYFIGTNKRCTVTERFTVWIHPMLTRYGIEHLLPKRLGIFELSVHCTGVDNNHNNWPWQPQWLTDNNNSDRQQQLPLPSPAHHAPSLSLEMRDRGAFSSSHHMQRRQKLAQTMVIRRLGHRYWVVFLMRVPVWSYIGIKYYSRLWNQRNLSWACMLSSNAFKERPLTLIMP